MWARRRGISKPDGQNNVEELPPGTPLTGYVSTPGATPQNFIPFPHLGAGCPTMARPATAVTTRCRPNGRTRHRWTGSSGWLHAGAGCQDAGDSLSSGGAGGYRAPGFVPISYDTGLASFNIKNQFVGSGTYALPVGRGKQLFGQFEHCGATHCWVVGASTRFSPSTAASLKLSPATSTRVPALVPMPYGAGRKQIQERQSPVTSIQPLLPTRRWWRALAKRVWLLSAERLPGERTWIQGFRLLSLQELQGD